MCGDAVFRKPLPGVESKVGPGGPRRKVVPRGTGACLRTVTEHGCSYWCRESLRNRGHFEREAREYETDIPGHSSFRKFHHPVQWGRRELSA